ncbi:MAG: SsrA-binding protein SmpB [Clostridiales Family XIII bacterium]|jgi:SsrA-binding protein|nr:SsrA-binding protein SmpB [Clostridiales Family XIII bacterium]
MAKKYRLIANNKKARHEYFIEDTLEVGIVLTGTEIKAIRDSKASLKESYIRVRDNQLVIYGMHIAPYDFGNRYNVDSMRERRLLAHKKEIARLDREVSATGMAIVPLKLYLDEKGLAKLSIAVARGKKLYDKRDTLKARDEKRNIDRLMKQH